jgi:hypothetical protein
MQVYTQVVDYSKLVAQELVKLHPLIPKLTENNVLDNYCFIAGGALIQAFIKARLLTPQSPYGDNFDIDIYCCFPYDAVIMKILSLCDTPYRAIMRGSNVINILCPNLPNIQIILTTKGEELVQEFDLKCCQAMFDGTSIKMTADFKKVKDNNWVEVLASKVSSNRLTKYVQRGIIFCNITKYESYPSEQVPLSYEQGVPDGYKHVSFPLEVAGSSWKKAYLEDTKRASSKFSLIDKTPFPRFILMGEFTIDNRETYEDTRLLQKAKDMRDKYIGALTPSQTNSFASIHCNSITSEKELVGKQCYMMFEPKIVRSLLDGQESYIFSHRLIGIRPI